MGVIDTSTSLTAEAVKCASIYHKAILGRVMNYSFRLTANKMKQTRKT